MRKTLTLIFAFIISPSVLAQWPPHMDDVPLLPDGSPDLDAPPPRMPDGKVDFSGTWD